VIEEKSMLFGTLLCKNEIDIIRQSVYHHLPLVQKLIITDNNSTDGTWELLQLIASKEPKVQLHRETNTAFEQETWVTNMILDAREQGATWVLNLDADEFITGPLLETINLVDSWDRTKTLILKVVNYAPSLKDSEAEVDPLKRITTISSKMHIPDKRVVRLKNFSRMGKGGHGAEYSDNDSYGGIQFYRNPHLYLKHYPYRSWYQYKEKVIKTSEAFLKSKRGKASGIDGVWSSHKLQPYKAYLENENNLYEIYKKEILCD
jgi:hypothetical protein